MFSQSKKKSKVLILLTGGGALAEFNKQSELVPGVWTVDKFLSYIPEVNQLASIFVKEVFHDDSANFTSKHWIKLAEVIYKEIPKYDGIVVIHGTDTMAYTASALSFFLQNLPIPIVMVGSNIPISFVSSPSRELVMDAVKIAGHADLAEVVILSHKTIIRGNRAKKVEEIDLRKFESINLAPLGMVQNNAIYLERHAQKRNVNLKPTSHICINDNIIPFLIYPGVHKGMLNKILDLKPDGIVLISYGSGNLPTNSDGFFTKFLFTAIKMDIIVFIAAQATYGNCWVSRYKLGKGFSERGTITSKDMTYECSIVKLKWVLAQTKNYKEVKKLLHTPVAGEIKEEILETIF